MKNQKAMPAGRQGFIPVIIILVVLIVLGGVYYLGTLKPEQAVESLKSTTDPTANWKTYMNNEFKYQLRYPQNLFILEEGAGTSVVIKESLDENTPGLFRIDLLSNANPQQYVVDKKWYANHLKEITGNNSSSVEDETIKEVFISSRPALKIIQPFPSLNRIDVGIFIPSGVDILVITYSIISESTFDQIASSFKFIN